MATGDQHGTGWTAVLPRQPVSIANSRQEGGYTAACEIRGDCGDHPDLDYSEVSPRLQLVRRPYPIAVGVAAYEQHLRLHQQLECATGIKSQHHPAPGRLLGSQQPDPP